MASKILKIEAVAGTEEVVYLFYCPGCEGSHPYSAPRWTFNGSLEMPTFSPSLLVGKDIPEKRCHLYITDGKIQFLGDCHHALANQTVEMTDWNDGLW